MRTITEALSQSIYKIPDYVRSNTININMDRVTVIPVMTAMIFVIDELTKEDSSSLIHMFAQDRFDNLRESIIGHDQVISADLNDDSIDEIDLSFDTDAISFINFACEHSLDNKDSFLKNNHLDEISDETKDAIFSILKLAAEKTTEAITKALLNYQ